MFSVSPISIVTLHQHDRLSDLGDLFRRTKSQKLAKTGVSLFTSVSHSHPAANKDIETSKTARGFILDCDKANIVGVDICVVYWWHSNSNFEPTLRKACVACY